MAAQQKCNSGIRPETSMLSTLARCPPVYHDTAKPVTVLDFHLDSVKI